MGQELSSMCTCFDTIQESKHEMSFIDSDSKSKIREGIEKADDDSENENPFEQVEEIQGFKYSAVSKLAGPAVQNFTQLINEGVEGYDVIIDKENCKVYSREANDGYIIKYTWNVQYSPQEFMDFMDKAELRKTWDSNIDTINVLGFYNPKESIVYTKYKKFLTFDPRDTLAFCKSTTINGNLAEVTLSVESEAYPKGEKSVRVILYCAGLYAESIDPDDQGNKTKITCLSHMDVGLPKALNNVARKFAGTTIPPLTKKICTELKKYYSQQ